MSGSIAAILFHKYLFIFTLTTPLVTQTTQRRIVGKSMNNHSSLMMEAARTSETSVDNYFTRQYIPQGNSELHTRRRENLKSHK
jgi:hypothetical protein